MKITSLSIITIILAISCSEQQEKDLDSNSKYITREKPIEQPPQLNLEQANKLAELPLACLQTEYPNKIGITFAEKGDVKEPHNLHPAFYGCFDWHSSVHGHWSLVKLLKEFPELNKADEIKTKLQQNITKANIEIELAIFKKNNNKSFERTYGWAWLLKLAEEIHSWDNTLGKELEQNLLPLTNYIAEAFIDFLPKLKHPIRVGEHTNTAFGLSFAWDFAMATKHKKLQNAIEISAIKFYGNDTNYPLQWEPGGYDFLSPCFEEIDLMRKVLKREEFNRWLANFTPQLLTKDFNLEVAKVSDRSDGKLVHLDGLNFSRAWVLYGLANQYNEFSHLIPLANKHINQSLPNLINDGYDGGHWLGSFAILALDYGSKTNSNK